MNFIDRIRVKREIRAKQREIAVIQALCPHEYTLLGEREYTDYNGYDVDFYRKQVLFCGVCEKETTVFDRREANIILVKQEARREVTSN